MLGAHRYCIVLQDKSESYNVFIIISLLTATVQAFLIDYTEKEEAISHYTGPVRIGGL
jgi:hypothetical protein